MYKTKHKMLAYLLVVLSWVCHELCNHGFKVGRPTDCTTLFSLSLYPLRLLMIATISCLRNCFVAVKISLIALSSQPSSSPASQAATNILPWTNAASGNVRSLLQNLIWDFSRGKCEDTGSWETGSTGWNRF